MEYTQIGNWTGTTLDTSNGGQVVIKGIATPQIDLIDAITIKRITAFAIVSDEGVSPKIKEVAIAGRLNFTFYYLGQRVSFLYNDIQGYQIAPVGRY